MKSYLFIVLIALSNTFYGARAAHEKSISVSSDFVREASYSFRSFTSSSSAEVSSSSSLSDYDFKAEETYEPFEDAFLFVSNPVVDLLDDDDDDFLPEVTVTKTRPVITRTAAPFLFSSSSSSTSSSASSSDSSGSDASPSELTFSTTRNRRAASASDFGGSSTSSSSSSSSSSDKKKKRDDSESPCDFAAAECKACRKCADDFDAERCICIVGERTTAVALGGRTDDVCVVVARESRMTSTITTGSGDDCVAIAGRVDDDIQLGFGNDDAVVVGGGALLCPNEILGEEGDDRGVVRAGGFACDIRGGADDDRFYIEEGAAANEVYGHESGETSEGSDLVVVAGTVYTVDVGHDGHMLRGFITSTGFVSEDFIVGEGDNSASILAVVGTGGAVGYDVQLEGTDIVVHWGGDSTYEMAVVGTADGSEIFAEIYSEASFGDNGLELGDASVSAVFHNRVHFMADLIIFPDSGVQDLNLEMHDYVSVGNSVTYEGSNEWHDANIYIGSHFTTDSFEVLEYGALHHLNVFVAPHSNTGEYFYAYSYNTLSAHVMGPSNQYEWEFEGRVGTVRFTGEHHAAYYIYTYGALDVFLSNVELSYYYGYSDATAGDFTDSPGQRVALGNFCKVYDFHVEEGGTFQVGSEIFIENGSNVLDIDDPSTGTDAVDIFDFENVNSAILRSCDAGFDNCPPQFENDKKKKKKRDVATTTSRATQSHSKLSTRRLRAENEQLSQKKVALTDELAALKAELAALRA